MDLRKQALVALQTQSIEPKLALTSDLCVQAAIKIVATDLQTEWPEPPHLPGCPARPELRTHLDVPQRSPRTAQGLAGLIHAVAHIEFNAINLALDAVWRFAAMPAAYYQDWLRVAAEEAQHFGLLRAQLQSMGYDYGDFAAHTGLWDMVERTKGDVVARMALVPRTLEARGLDATPPMQAKLRKVDTPDALRTVDILDIILQDEIGHVAIGNHWYHWLCEQRGLESVAHYQTLTLQYQAPKLRAPFNVLARERAGFTPAEMAQLQR